MSGGSVPKLRFPGFVGEWQEKRLGDALVAIDAGWSPQCLERPAVGQEWAILKTTSVMWEGYDDQQNKALPVHLKPRQKLQATTGDILITRAGPINRVAVVAHVGQTRPKLMISDKLMRARATTDNDSDFLARLLGTTRVQNYFAARKSGLAEAQANISQSILARVPMQIPTLPEQKKIASFLGVVDAKIAALRARVLGLQTYKRGLMKALFSQTLRFTKPDGTAFPDWEEKRLGEVATRCKAKNGDLQYMRVLTNSAVQGVVDQGSYFDKDIANAENLGGYYIVKLGDFVYNPRISVTAPVGPIKRNDLGNGVMSPLYTVFRFKEANSDFFNTYFETTFWHDYMKSVANYGARHDRMAISMGDFMEMPLPFPHPDEQAKIAEALSGMDAKIAAVQGQVDRMQDFKKGLLQQMFV